MPGEVEAAIRRDLHRDLETALARLHEAYVEQKRLRLRLRLILNCDDEKCALCARCLALVRED